MASNLSKVLENLALVHDRYVSAEENDCTFWYKERPQIGWLASAVWLSGGVALEEFGTTKSKGKGRCDLYFRLNSLGYECEGKYLWMNYGEGADKCCKKFCEMMRAAIENVQSSKNSDVAHLAVNFGTVAIPRGKPESTEAPFDLAKIITEAMKKDYDEFTVQAISLEGKLLFGSDGQFCYPGLVIAMVKVAPKFTVID